MADRANSDTQTEMHKILSRLTTELPSYIWLTVYPQVYADN